MNTFDLEATVRKWTIPWYQARGYTVREVEGKKNREHDLFLERNGRSLRVEEKAEAILRPNFCFELIQDVKTKNMGWIYDLRADLIIYIFWNVEAVKPFIVYKVNWQTCKTFCLDNLADYPLKINNRGFGLTIFSIIPWRELMHEKIAEIIYAPALPESELAGVARSE
jgi:hypothetical protein